MAEQKDTHITTRVDPELKRRGIELADRIERKKAWVFAKAIELGLPEVVKRYANPKKKAA